MPRGATMKNSEKKKKKNLRANLEFLAGSIAHPAQTRAGSELG